MSVMTLANSICATAALIVGVILLLVAVIQPWTARRIALNVVLAVTGALYFGSAIALFIGVWR